MTETVQSADGTTIAYERIGTGPAVILVGGAFSTRHSALPLASLLAPHFTSYAYDRRGRGESTDTAPYAVEREVEDLLALAEATGETPGVYGHSSGAVLALEAASRGVPMSRLAVYEPPYTHGSDHPVFAGDNGVQAALDAGDRERAARAFMQITGLPEQSIEGMRQAPFWQGMLAIAHTLPYDLALTGDGRVPVDRLATISMPTLVMDGGASGMWAGMASVAVAGAITGARRLTVAGQGHGAAEPVLVPILSEFFG